jgi:hypothetical protein
MNYSCLQSTWSYILWQLTPHIVYNNKLPQLTCRVETHGQDGITLCMYAITECVSRKTQLRLLYSREVFGTLGYWWSARIWVGGLLRRLNEVLWVWSRNLPTSIVKPTWCTFYSILLRIKGLYTFRALFAHLQGLVDWNGTDVTYTSFTPILVHPTDLTRTQYSKCRLWSASWGWASNAWNM